MNLKEYIEQLQEFVKENPQALEFDVWYAKDDEGNGYQEVYFSPSLKVYDIDDKYNDRCDYMLSDGDGDIDDIIENDRRVAVIVNWEQNAKTTIKD